MRKIILVITMLFLLIGCNKNQKYNRLINGKWFHYKNKSISNIGVPNYYNAVDSINTEYNFLSCKYKHNDYCSLEIKTLDSYGSSIKTVLKRFKISGDGELLDIKNSVNDSIIESYKITNLNSQELSLVHYNENGKEIFNYFVKQKK